MRGIIVVNPFGFPGQSIKQAERLSEEFNKLNVKVEIVKDGFLKNQLIGGNLSSELKGFDFAVFLDKDKYLSSILTKMGVRLFNTHEAIRVCDDKGDTYIALSNNGIKMPDTIFAPLCYKEESKVDENSLKVIAGKLGFPMIVKESYGSMGHGVHKVDDFESLIELENKIKTKPHLFQKYYGEKVGTDIRAIVIGGQLLTAMERYNQNDFRSNIALGGKGKPITLSEEFKSVAEKSAKILGLDYCGVDILYDDDNKPIVCEVNSNAFFEGIESVTKVNVALNYAKYIIEKINE
ncbi:MAG: RimK family alpha-L-glutamate ligase [Clostridia bacterium]|nr:RimK family alpha-L-glutamate ligase [Clostridia bacterium]